MNIWKKEEEDKMIYSIIYSKKINIVKEEEKEKEDKIIR